MFWSWSSCRNLHSFVVYKYVSGSGSITSVGEERELICLLLFTCNYVVSVLRGFLFIWVLRMGSVILLWHSLSLPYNYILINELLFVLYFCSNNIKIITGSTDSSVGKTSDS